MAIKAYVGRQGSGKTYEVATRVILGALRQGRRVVSNIAGLNEEAMRAILLDEGIPEERIGQIVSVEHEAVLDPFFWRADFRKEREWQSFRRFLLKSMDEEDLPDGLKKLELREFFIQPGDVLCLDEIWRFWSGFKAKDDDGNLCPPTVINFIRMHRHFTHPDTGVSCDMAIITQDVNDINRRVRSVIEETYYMEKLTALGSTKRYRVDIHQGGRIGRKPLRSLQCSYNPAYFGLYASHSQRNEGDAEAREENIDKRGNLLASPLFRIVLPIMLLIVLPLAFWRVWVFLHPAPDAAKVAAGATPSTAAGTPGQAVSQAKRTPEVSDTWRASGYYASGSDLVIVVSDGQSLRPLSNPPNYRFAAFGIETFLPGGEAVTSWGGRREAGLIGKAAGQ